MDTTDITPTTVEVIDPKRQRLAVLAEDTRTRMKRSALDIYHIGANLLEAQNLLAHGEFLPWIEAEFDMSQRSAYKFISVGKAFQGKFAQNANLEIAASALYLLASSETPDDARNEALELAAAGETISPKKAKKIIEKHTSVEQETTALGKALGLPTQGNSTLPESDRIDDLTHSSPVDVDDRPGTAPPPSPWALMAKFSISVGDGSVVQVKFSPEGLIHRFDFRGAVSETGYCCEFIPAQIAQRYRSPKECATALVDDLHAQWMKAKPKPYKHGIAAGDTVRVLLGRGKHSDKITTATSVTAKEILTPLGTFKANAVVKYVDRTPEMKALGIVPGAMVKTSDGTKAEVVCTFADGRVLASDRYYRYSELTVLEPATVAQPTENSESAEAEDSGAIARSVESMLPEILASESEPDKEKQAPAELSEVGSAADMDALIDFHGTTVVARMYAQASPDLQQTIKDFYPGIGAIVTSELGGSEFNKIADRAGFLPNHEPDAVRVEMLLQENARLDQALRLCEEHVERLEQENRKLKRKLEGQQTELDRINKENTDLQERIRNSEGTAELQRAKIT